MKSFDVAVVGGGMIGSAIAHGLIRYGLSVVLLDEGDCDWRAARGNFGLVWVQGKGADAPAYAEWTRQAADSWPGFAAELEEQTSIDLGYERRGGIELCLDEREFAELHALMRRGHNQPGRELSYEMLDRQELTRYLPKLGEQVVGGCYCPLDGHVNPLYLLRALHTTFQNQGGHYQPNCAVTRIEYDKPGFSVFSVNSTFHVGQVVLAAGFSNQALAKQVSLNVSLKPIRGQVLVTEKLKPFLALPTLHIRQTSEGGCLLGDSHEDVGFDAGTTRSVMQTIARRAVATFPFLANVRVIRAWGALRIMTPDGMPIYDESEGYPGAFVASAHSGVTLAAGHARSLAAWIATGEPPSCLNAFRTNRFDV